VNRAPLVRQGSGESGRPHPQVKERITIKIKRAYEPLARGDGYRVLIDRLWPRGVRKGDEEHNNAVVLRNTIKRRARSRARKSR
jgi:Inactive DUF488-N3 subclade